MSCYIKKFCSCLLILALCLGLCPIAQGEEAVHIVFWHSMSEEAGEILQTLVDEFNQTNQQNIYVEAVFQGKYSDATGKMNNILSAASWNELPDVMNLDATGKVNFYQSGKMYSVDAALADEPGWDVSVYEPTAYANWCYAGVQLGIPFATSTTLTYYNKSLVPDGIDTLGDLAALQGTTGEAAVFACVPATPTLVNWLGQQGSLLTDMENGTLGSAGQVVCLENGALEAFLGVWKALYASGALKNESESIEDFVSGKLAVMLYSSSHIVSIQEKIGGSFELGIGFYPRVDENASCGATVNGSCLVMFDSGDETRKQAARTFVQYMTGADAQARFCAATGYLPSHTGAEQTPVYQAFLQQNPLFYTALEQVKETPSAMRSLTVGPSVDFYYAIQNNIMDMLDEDWSAEETALILTEELNGLLQRYNRNNQ